MQALTSVVALCLRILMELLSGNGAGTSEGQRAQHGQRADLWRDGSDRGGEAFVDRLGQYLLKRQPVRIPVRAAAHPRLPEPERR
ncbi:MAG: hypothetical protein KF861_08005 [Planctomycetaceae bacterium]|nr:hypothetical protein [Planctomycetaceae bacterium]